MPTRLAARNIEVHYASGTPPVLSQVTLELKPSVFLGIIGPNGSGKSTLIRALSRALKPVGGVVLLEERDLYTGYSARSSAQRIAVAPQETGISLDFSVREVVRMGRAPHLPPRPFASETAADEQWVTEALRAAQVEALAERSVTTLSGGERQRVLFARALAQQADILLLDEPTASLDLRHQSETLALARDLAHGGKAVLAVLHDVNLASEYCDELVLLQGGKSAAQGTPTEVLTAENLRAVYGARVWVRPHPVSGRPLVLALPEMPDKSVPMPRPKVHVICGGGSGAGLLVALHRQGFSVTAAGLNAGDTDADAAQMLGVPFAEEAAFSPLSDTVLGQADYRARAADVVVLTDVSFGPVNLGNLEAALTLRRAGKPVLCLQNPADDFAVRDFTGGAASALWSVLLDAGATLLPNTAAILTSLNNWKQEDY